MTSKTGSTNGPRNARLTRVAIASVLPLILALSHATVADVMPMSRAMLADTIAQIRIEGTEITAELEIGVASLPAFRDILPPDLYARLGYEAEPLADRMFRFFTEGFVLELEDGNPLLPRVESIEGRPRIERDEITGEPIASSEDEVTLFLSLVYQLQQPPRTLTIVPPSTPRNDVMTDIGLVVYHRGLAINDFRYLSGSATIDLDWDDPWFSAFQNPNMRRYYREPASVFLYVEPLEVRREIVIRPIDLQHWVDLGLGDKEIITSEHRADIRTCAAEFLLGTNPVKIDGQLVKPVLDRVHFIRRTLRTASVVEPGEDIPLLSAELGVIVAYPVTSLPDKVTMTWELFNDRIREVPAVATDEAGGLPARLRPDDRVLTWNNFLLHPTVPGLVEVEPPRPRTVRIPIPTLLLSVLGLALLLSTLRPTSGRTARCTLGALLLVGAASLWTVGRIDLRVGGLGQSPEQPRELMSSTLLNVYRAFDFRKDSDIYDVLALSADGEILTDLFLETTKALELRNQGGARVRVRDVDIVELDIQPLTGKPGFSAKCTWNVIGSVGHWGHVHQRTNRYVAHLDLQPLDGRWKITDMKLLTKERI